MNFLQKIFLRGLVVVVPVTLTIYVIVAVTLGLEGFFAKILKNLLGGTLYLPGMGIALTFLLILLMGILVSNFLTRRIVQFFASLLEKVPFFKAVYRPLKDLMSLFGQNSSDHHMKKVVLVELREQKIKALGLVTRENFRDLTKTEVLDDHIVVYIPMSYMIGGFSAIVHKDQVTEIDISVEKAFKLGLTGWIQAQGDTFSKHD